MIVDSSAIVAILRKESTGASCLNALGRAAQAAMSAATFLETSIVLENKPELVSSADFDLLLLDFAIAIEPVTESQARIARLAYRQFGKGHDHRARLNFGDCFAYALAREKNEPLLFVGDDFSHTDIRPALTQT